MTDLEKYLGTALSVFASLAAMGMFMKKSHREKAAPSTEV
jgi:hypothetical protein